jgi:hypothetical protein
MRVYGEAVDPVDTERARLKCRHRDRRRDDRIDLLKNLQERRAQAVAAIIGLDIIDAAIGRALGHDVAVVAVGIGERAYVAARHGRRLLGIGDRLQDPLQHIGRELYTIRHDAGAERAQGVDRQAARLAHIGRDRRVAEVDTASDPDAVEFSRARIEASRRHRQAGGIAQVMRRDHFQQQRRVGHRARNRSGMRKRGP